MIYRNNPLLHKLQSPVQILQSQTARTQLPMSSTAIIQQGLGSEQLRVNNKNEHLPTHDYHIGQSVMYLNPINKRWYPAKIRSLYQEPRSYKIETDDGTIYRKTQNHLNCSNARQIRKTKMIHEQEIMKVKCLRVITIYKLDLNIKLNCW